MDELDELLQEDEMMMNNQNQQQVPTSLDLDSAGQEVTMNTLTPHEGEACRTTGISSSWLDINDDVYTPVLPEQLQDLCRILDEPVVEEEMVQDLQYHDDEESEALMLNFAADQMNPSLDNIAGSFQIPESPFLVDNSSLYSIDNLHIQHSLQQQHAPQEPVDEEAYPSFSEHLINFDVAVGSCDLTFLDKQVTASTDNANHGQHNNEDAVAMLPVLDDVPSTVNRSKEIMESIVAPATDKTIEMEVRNPACEQGNAGGETNGTNTTDPDNDDEHSNKRQATGTTSSSACKNLVSERNRRKRLGEQLLALRSLVPNITKMDKRSVLVDALGYLRSIHEETTKLESELTKQNESMPSTSGGTTTTTPASTSAGYSKSIPSGTIRNAPALARRPTAAKSSVTITEIDTEEIEDRRFVVKITCKISRTSGISSSRVGADVLRVMESLGFEITYTSNTTTAPTVVENQSPRSPKGPKQVLVVLTTLFIKVRNSHGKMTEETLRDCITNRALRLGLAFQTHKP